MKFIWFFFFLCAAAALLYRRAKAKHTDDPPVLLPQDSKANWTALHGHRRVPPGLDPLRRPLQNRPSNRRRPLNSTPPATPCWNPKPTAMGNEQEAKVMANVENHLEKNPQTQGLSPRGPRARPRPMANPLLRSRPSPPGDLESLGHPTKPSPRPRRPRQNQPRPQVVRLPRFPRTLVPNSNAGSETCASSTP